MSGENGRLLPSTQGSFNRRSRALRTTRRRLCRRLWSRAGLPRKVGLTDKAGLQHIAGTVEPNWTPLLSGVVGAVIGGLFALLGTVLTQWAIGKREAQARREAEAQRREWELRLAYAEWMGATQRAIIALSTMQMLPQEKQDPAALISTITTEIALFGSRVRLLEPDAAARKKTGEAVGVVSVALAELTSQSDTMAQMRELSEAMGKLAQIEMWITEDRFKAAD